MKNWSLLMAIVAFPLAAQKAPKRVEPMDTRDFQINETDRFTGEDRVLSQVARLSGGDSHGTIAFWRRIKKDKSDTLFLIEVTYTAPDWLFIREHEPSFLLLLDGKNLDLTPMFKPDHEVKHFLGDTYVTETLQYQVSPADLFAIAKAQEIAWRMVGDKRKVEGDASRSNFNRLRGFLVWAFPDSVLYNNP